MPKDPSKTSLALIPQEGTYDLSLAQEALGAYGAEMSDQVRTALIIKSDRLLPLLAEKINEIRAMLRRMRLVMQEFDGEARCLRTDVKNMVHKGFGKTLGPNKDNMGDFVESKPIIETLIDRINQEIQQIIFRYREVNNFSRRAQMRDGIAREKGFSFPQNFFVSMEPLLHNTEAYVGSRKCVCDCSKCKPYCKLTDDLRSLIYRKAAPYMSEGSFLQLRAEVMRFVEAIERYTHRCGGSQNLDSKYGGELISHARWVVDEPYDELNRANVAYLGEVNREFRKRKPDVQLSNEQLFGEVEKLCSTLRQMLATVFTQTEYLLEQHEKARDAILRAIG